MFAHLRLVQKYASTGTSPAVGPSGITWFTECLLFGLVSRRHQCCSIHSQMDFLTGSEVVFSPKGGLSRKPPPICRGGGSRLCLRKRSWDREQSNSPLARTPKQAYPVEISRYRRTKPAVNWAARIQIRFFRQSLSQLLVDNTPSAVIPDPAVTGMRRPENRSAMRVRFYCPLSTVHLPLRPANLSPFCCYNRQPSIVRRQPFPHFQRSTCCCHRPPSVVCRLPARPPLDCLCFTPFATIYMW